MFMVVHKRIQSQYVLFPPIKEIMQFAGFSFVTDEKFPEAEFFTV